jgi:hypothetical protein
MSTTRKAARVAGLLYVLMSIPGVWGLIYVPSRLIVSGDPAATARNILASETLFRSGIVANLVSQAGFVLVALALYRLLKHVDALLALLMVIWISISIPIVFVAEAHLLGIPTLLDPTGPAAALSDTGRIAMTALSLRAYSNTIQVAEIFWGLWLIPMGLLIFRSGFLPRFLGVLLFLAATGYLIECVSLLLPAYGKAVEGIAAPLRALELVIPLWLLIAGAKDQPLLD